MSPDSTDYLLRHDSPGAGSRPGLVRPSAVPAGGRIAVVSPSGPAPARFPHRFERGLSVLRAAGYEVVEGRSARADAGLTAGTPSARLDDLHWAFEDPSVHAVVCSIGGRLSAQLLPQLDTDLIAANPKVFCGYSDATSLHCAIGAATGLTTFYGAAVMPELAELPAPAPVTLDSFLGALQRPCPPGPLPEVSCEVVEHVDWADDRPRRTRPAPGLIVARSGSGRGTLIAACLPVLAHLAGTPYLPDLRGAVLLLDTPQAPYSAADAASDLWLLRLAGLLDDVAAVAVGRPHLGVGAAELADAVHQHLPTAVAPVVVGLPVGHSYPNLTVPIGADAELDDTGLRLLGGGVLPAT